MKLNQMITAAALSIALPAISFGAQAKVITKWTYQNTDGTKVEQQEKAVSVPEFGKGHLNEDFTSDNKMSKTLVLLGIANEIRDSLTAYSKVCESVAHQYHDRVRPGPDPRVGGPEILPYPPRIRPEIDCQAERRKVADKLKAEIVKLDAKVNANPWARSDKGAIEALDYARKLVGNMEKAPEPRPMFENAPTRALSRGAVTTAAMPSMAPGGASLNVTSGGAQGYDQFKKIIDSGYVPATEVLPVDGFLKDFDLSLTDDVCDQLLCVSPAVTTDAAAKKMYVQISMGSNVKPESFKRKPLNLSVVLDISGSMQDSDGTEKSRLEWAKDALNRTVDMLGEQDVLSIVTFDTQSEVVLQPVKVTNRTAIKDLIKNLATRGSTNMEAGMKDGLRLVDSKLNELKGYEHRVITISDAGTNTGIRDEASFVRLVNKYAQAGIGITVLGIGDDFQGGLVQGFAMTKGGNFQHAQTGLAMLKFFDNFDFLVTPIAYNFKANIALDGVNAKFAKAYGVPVKEGQAVDELINIDTLFFSAGGGAIVLEYSIE